jgi:hypothetical protein
LVAAAEARQRRTFGVQTGLLRGPARPPVSNASRLVNRLVDR